MRHLFLTGLVLAFIIWLLRRKVSMTAVMPIGAGLLALLYRLPVADCGRAVWQGVASPKSLEMTATLALTMMMEHQLRTTGMLKRMVVSLSNALPDRRMVMAALPAMIGMLPSPGGAVFSAPMVAEAAEGVVASPEQKALINYWYRHIWEYISPLYPGIILAAGLTGFSTQQLFLAHLPFALTVIAAGAWFCFRGIDRLSPAQCPSGGSRLREFGVFLQMSSPILISLALVVVFKVSAVLALSGGVCILFIAHRYGPLLIVKTMRESLSFKALLLVTGIMVFQEVLRATGALAGISGFFAASHLPIPLLMALIPFIAGVMTGLTVGYVGITFPLLLPLMGDVQPNLWLESLAFASGFAGVMLSPVHLCFVLTREYFAADTALVYHRLIVPSIVVLMAVVIPCLIYR
jgi:integral membrane protein (TIGR00529 family)